MGMCVNLVIVLVCHLVSKAEEGSVCMLCYCARVTFGFTSPKESDCIFASTLALIGTTQTK